MTRCCKVWFALWLVLLANFFATACLRAATYYIDSATYMVPDALPNANTPANIIPGDIVVFKIGRNQTLSMNGSPMFGGALLFQGSEHAQTFNEEGVFDISSSYSLYAYCRITVTRPVNAAPTVSITNLALRVARPAGSNLVIQALADDEDGSIRRVIFHYGLGTNTTTVTNIIGTSSVAPYSITWSNPVAGKYLLRAQAYDNLEVFANSPRVALSLYTPFTNSLPGITNISGVSNLVFRFNSDTGLVYVTEVSGNLTNWTPFITNTATNSLIEVLDTNVTTLSNRFFRIRLVP